MGHIKLGTSNVASLLLVLFPYIIALGAYSQTNMLNIVLYMVIASVLLIMNPSRVLRFRKNKQLLSLWVLFILVGLISTIIFKQFTGLKTIFVEVLFTFICYVLCAFINPIQYFSLLRWSMLIFSVLGLLTFLFKIDVFAFKSSLNVIYSSIDSESGGGISTIFEYRHYYGLFLVTALFIQFIYPFKRFTSNLLATSVIGINIIATYTRSVWIVLIICALFWGAKNFNGQLSPKTAKRIIFFLLALIILLLTVFVLDPDRILGVFNNISLRMDVFDTSDKYFGGVRLYVLREGFRYIFSNWTSNLLFGGGSGYAMQWLRQHPFGRWGEWSSSIDVQYVTSFMDCGIIGLILIFAIIKRVLTTFFKANESVTILVSFILIYFIFILFFYDVFGAVISAFPLWCICISLLEKRDYENGIK